MPGRLPVDEEYASLIATTAGIAAAALAVADCIFNGMVTTAQHLGVALASFLAVRFTVGRSLRPVRTSTTAEPATED